MRRVLRTRGEWLVSGLRPPVRQPWSARPQAESQGLSRILHPAPPEGPLTAQGPPRASGFCEAEVRTRLVREFELK